MYYLIFSQQWSQKSKGHYKNMLKTEVDKKMLI